MPIIAPSLTAAPTPILGAEKSRGRAVGVVMLIAASVLWSISGVVLKKTHVDPVGFAFWRSLAAGICMAALLPFSRGVPPKLKWLALAIALHAIVVTLLLTSMALFTAAAGIILQYTGPVFCALFAWIFQRRAIGGRTALALCIAMVGVTIMLIGGLRDGANLVGLINGAISGVAFGGLILTLEVVNRSGRDGQAVNPFLVVMLNNLGTAAIVLPVALRYGHVRAETWQLLTLAGTGVVQLAIPYVLFILALRRVEPVDASLLILLEPVLNPVWVWLAVGERPDVATFIGGGAILIAMLLEATKEKREYVNA